MKAGARLIQILILLCLVIASAWSAEPRGAIVPLDRDGVQRQDIAVDSYFFTPSHLIVKVDLPVELFFTSAAWLLSHNFVLKSLEGGLDIEQEIPAWSTAKIRFTPTRVGAYSFSCTKRLPFSSSHEELGMVGTLEVVR